MVQSRIHFLRLPAETRGVLRHFEAGGCHAARVGGLARCKQHACLQEQIRRVDGGRHVCPFGDRFYAVANQRARGFSIQLVLRGARQGDIHRHAPRLFTFEVGQAKLPGVIRYASIAAGFDFTQARQLLCREARFIHHRSAGVRGGHHASAKLHRFFNRVLRHVTGAGNGYAHAFEA